VTNARGASQRDMYDLEGSAMENINQFVFSIRKISFPDSIEIDDNVTPINAEPPLS
jgi:hypothetical protein